MKGGGLARETENRASRARFRLDMEGGVGEGPRGWCGAGDGRVSGLGGLEARARERGWFGARNRKPSPVGSVLAGQAGEGWGRDEGGCVVWGMAK